MNHSKSSNGSPKLSPWWDAVTQPPVHVGWYDTMPAWALHCADGHIFIVRLWWSGKAWRLKPRGRRGSDFGWRGDTWRGVLREDEA